MKLKKFMFTASSLAVGTSLIGGILTSCSKATVDEKNKISLDDNGGLCNEKTVANFKDALKDALSRSSNWATFKAALADELVYRWYVDRAAVNKDSTEKNPTFRVNLDEWTDKINKDYDETIKSLKNKYTDKWEFYLQNEILDPVGGTETAYKHAKLVEKARAEFLSKVFATNYFGYKNPKESLGPNRAKYPNIYSKASINIAEDSLKDPTTWANLGFYARTNTSFAPGDEDTIDGSFLAKNPDGDYATIQNYVFDRWFKTEKPFFSAASLFKYSNPKYVAESKLTGIYDGVSTGVKIPDNPNESFPFFGAYPSSESAKGTNAYIAWYEQLLKDGFDTEYQKEDKTRANNGTITIKKTLTEDSQTLLLSFGSQMIGGSANALYIPYANAAASLYLQMITGDTKYAPLNSIEQTQIATSIENHKAAGQFNDGSAILENFMYAADTAPTNIQSYIDLAKVYPSGLVKETPKAGGEEAEFYHCPLFKSDKDYTFLHGETGTNGVRYVTNAVQVTLGKTGAGEGETQPWIFELNEAGMHAQTIDGYKYVVKQAAGQDRQNALKEVLKYRLMQKKCGYNAEVISGDVFGDSGKLKSYFSDNFTNIILEMAFSGDAALNIFRPIDTYKDSKTGTEFENTLFLSVICTDEKLSNFANIKAYLELTNKYDQAKKYVDAYETANNKTYAYRTKQMENAKTVEKHRTVYENGLLAPLAYTCEVSNDGVSTRIYNTADITMLDSQGTLPEIKKYTRTDLVGIMSSVKETELYKSVNDDLKPNQENALSPQISTAKSKTSNRFWYKSYIVDKMMYGYMSNKDGMANFIKGSAMQKYMSKMFGESEEAKKKVLSSLEKAFVTTYAESKLFTNDRNYASFGKQTDSTSTDFYSNLYKAFENEYDYKTSIGGSYCDDYLNLKTYFVTLTYLIGKDKNFENFYKILNGKISEDEMALVGYVNKTNKNIWNGKTFKDVPIDVNAATTDLTKTDFLQYDWIADVNNIFDNTEYTGKTDREDHPVFDDAWITCDQYWKTIEKTVGPTSATTRFLSGFTGIQTKSSNQLDSASKLQSAAFDNFAKCSDGSLVLSKDDTEKKFRNPDDSTRYAENYGCWFSYAGTYEYNNEGQKVVYTFPDVTYDSKTIKPDNFKIDDNHWYPALKLAKRIAEYRSIDDLRELAKKLGASFYGDSIFRQIGDGTKKINNIDELKYTMLNELLVKENDQFTYLKCFQRMTDAELHEEGSAAISSKDYGFTDDKGNTYRILMTQLNKADVTEKTLTPEWKDDAWVFDYDRIPIQEQEFWYILSNMAMESSVQQMAISEVVKEVYGDDKLVVYDAQLYNCFDSVWIKDWTKKTMGA